MSSSSRAKINAKKRYFKSVTVNLVKRYFLIWSTRSFHVLFWKFEKKSNANLNELYNENNLSRLNLFVTNWTIWFHCRCKNQKNQCKKKIFSICINNTQKSRSNQKLWSLTFQSIYTQKSYHRVERIDQSFEKRTFTINHVRWINDIQSIVVLIVEFRKNENAKKLKITTFENFQCFEITRISSEYYCFFFSILFFCRLSLEIAVSNRTMI